MLMYFIGQNIAIHLLIKFGLKNGSNTSEENDKVNHLFEEVYARHVEIKNSRFFYHITIIVVF